MLAQAAFIAFVKIWTQFSELLDTKKKQEVRIPCEVASLGKICDSICNTSMGHTTILFTL